MAHQPITVPNITPEVNTGPAEATADFKEANQSANTSQLSPAKANGTLEVPQIAAPSSTEPLPNQQEEGTHLSTVPQPSPPQANLEPPRQQSAVPVAIDPIQNKIPFPFEYDQAAYSNLNNPNPAPAPEPASDPATALAPVPASPPASVPAPATPAEDDEDDDNDLTSALKKARAKFSTLKGGPMKWMPAKDAYGVKAALKDLADARKKSKKRLLSRKTPHSITGFMNFEKNFEGFLPGDWTKRPKVKRDYINGFMRRTLEADWGRYCDLIFGKLDDDDDPVAPEMPNDNDDAGDPAAVGVDADDDDRLPNGWAMDDDEVGNASPPFEIAGTADNLPSGPNVSDGNQDSGPSAAAITTGEPPSKRETQQPISNAYEAGQPSSGRDSNNTTQAAAPTQDLVSETTASAAPAGSLNSMMSKMSIGKRSRDSDDESPEEDPAKCRRTTGAEDVGDTPGSRRPIAMFSRNLSGSAETGETGPLPNLAEMPQNLPAASTTSTSLPSATGMGSLAPVPQIAVN